MTRDRGRVLRPMTDLLPLRSPGGASPARLTADELRQPVAAGVDGVGQAWSRERLLDEGESFGGVELWDALDADGRLAYRLWIDGADDGTVLRADTIEIVAGVSQGGMELARRRDRGTTDALLDALRAAARALPRAERPRGSCLHLAV
ncbi:MAG TPA: hypothetical protein PKA64_23420, partial [Myxococcota bacterium]|nr:hypothetical protein [Myxococcota bacterium]